MNDRIDVGYSGTQVLLAFLGGAAAGAVVALLTAPQTGAETRAQLRGVANKSRERASRIPIALKGAVGAAREAFNDSIAESLEAENANAN